MNNIAVRFPRFLGTTKAKGFKLKFIFSRRNHVAVLAGLLVICALSANVFFSDKPLGLSTDDRSPTFAHVTALKSTKLFQLRPANATSLLALARTFEEEGDNEIAIAVYRKVAEGVIPKDDDLSLAEQISLSYFCHYRISRCYLARNESQKAIINANKAYQILSRKEPYYHVAQFFDEHENDEATALHYYGLAAKAPKAPSDVPFKEAIIYDMDIEKDIVWPKAFPHSHLQDLQRYQDILDNPIIDEDVHLQTHGAMVLITRPLFYAGYEELFRKEGPFRPDDEKNEFYYSTPTIVRLQSHRADDFLIVCRLVNYRIDPVTLDHIDYLPPQVGTDSRSALALHHGIEDLQGTLVTVFDEIFVKSATFAVGPEDPKLLRVHHQEEGTDDLLLTMTSFEYSNIAGNGARMVSGTLHPNRGILEVRHAYPSPYNREWEKNWVAFQRPGDQDARIHFVYEWYPLTIGTLKDEANHMIDFHTTIDTPSSFKYLRGSSNGVVYHQEIWFMVHGTGHIGYSYYHKIVVLDAQTLQVKRHSYPFKLEGFHKEFCLGLDLDEGNEAMTIAYSIMDGSSVLRRVALWKVEALMVSK